MLFFREKMTLRNVLSSKKKDFKQVGEKNFLRFEKFSGFRLECSNYAIITHLFRKI